MDWKLILTIAYNLAYTIYICKVLIGGLNNKRIKPLQYIIVILMLIPFFFLQFNGIQHTAEYINLLVILTLAVVKGIVLGRRKVVEKIGDIWFMHHDKIYIVIWVSIFAFKIAATQAIHLSFGITAALWQTIVYFGTYYLVRTITIFLRHPDMSKDLFRQKLIQPKLEKNKRP